MARKFLPALLFLFLLLIVLLAYFYFQPVPKAAQAQGQIFFVAVRPHSFHIIEESEQGVFFSPFTIESAGASEINITLSCSEERQPSGFCILEHPAAIGFDAAGFKRGFEAGLQSFGLEVKKVASSQLQNCMGATVLIPTGVLPSESEELLKEAQEGGSHMVFAGELSGFSIDAQGQVQKLVQNSTAQKIEQRMEIAPSSLNSNLYAAGYSFALSKIYAKGANAWSASLQLSSPAASRNSSLIASVPQNISNGYCRLIYEATSANGSHMGGIAQSAKLLKLPPMRGSQEIFAGTLPYYSAWIEPAADSKLALYAAATDFAGSSARQKVFEGSIREGWLGGFEIRNISRAGYYIVSLEDQFSRAYAKSLLHVQELEIAISQTDGTTYYFNATVDGKPVDAQFATVSLEGSNASMQYPVASGAFIVAARPTPSQNAFLIELLGVKKRIAFTQARNPFLTYILQFGAPVLFASLLLFLILRRRPKRKYTLRVPDFTACEEQQIAISKKDFLEAFELANAHFGWKKLPLDCNELAIGLRAKCGSKGMLAQLSRQGIEDALAQLQKSGCIQAHAGFYAPSSWKLSIEQAASMRVLANILVQKGCAFSPLLPHAERISAACPFENVCIHAYSPSFASGKYHFVAGAKNILAFDSQQQMRSFLHWLKSGSVQAARISLLIKNKRLFLCVSSGVEELL